MGRGGHDTQGTDRLENMVQERGGRFRSVTPAAVVGGHGPVEAQFG